jgi:hypothetical protein
MWLPLGRPSLAFSGCRLFSNQACNSSKRKTGVKCDLYYMRNQVADDHPRTYRSEADDPPIPKWGLRGPVDGTGPGSGQAPKEWGGAWACMHLTATTVASACRSKSLGPPGNDIPSSPHPIAMFPAFFCFSLFSCFSIGLSHSDLAHDWGSSHDGISLGDANLGLESPPS